MRIRSVCSAVLSVVLLIAVVICSPAKAIDTWTDLMPGVRHLHRTTNTPWNIHVLVIDLTNPRVKLRVGIKHDNDNPDNGETVRSICQRYNAIAGINTDYFGWDQYVNHCPQGYTMTDGVMLYPRYYERPPVPDRTTMMIPADNSFVYINKVNSPLPWWFNVTAGGPRIIRDGVVGWEPENDIPDQTSRQPRTGAAVTQDWKTLILATVDGRQSGFSVGMTANEMGNLLKEFGGYQGMGFDGGGSTTMVINGVTVNSPSDGSDRAVADCLMVLDRFGETPNPDVHYQTGFEKPGYVAGSLSGVDGWIGAGDVVVPGRASRQCARFSNSSAYRYVSTTGLKEVQWVECWIRSSASTSGAYFYTAGTNTNDIASAVRLGYGGNIEALDGNGSGAGTWKTVGTYSAGKWHCIQVRLDYRLNNYQAFVDGSLKITGAGFRNSGASSGLGSIKFQEMGGVSSFDVDDIYASNYEPVVSLDRVKALPDGAYITLSELVVTGVYNGFVYLEDQSRLNGIRVVTTRLLAEGDSVRLTGRMATQNGERVIQSAVIDILPQ